MCLSQVDNVNNLQRTKWSGEGSTGRSTMKYHKTEADSTTFWLLWKGDEIEVLSAIGGFDEAAQNFKSDPGEIS